MEPTKNLQKSEPLSSKEVVTETPSAPGLPSASRIDVAYPPDMSQGRATILITIPVILIVVIAVAFLSMATDEESAQTEPTATPVEDNSEVVLELREDVQKSVKKADALVEDINHLQKHLAVQQTERDLQELYKDIKRILLIEDSAGEEALEEGPKARPRYRDRRPESEIEPIEDPSKDRSSFQP